MIQYIVLLFFLKYTCTTTTQTFDIILKTTIVGINNKTTAATIQTSTINPFIIFFAESYSYCIAVKPQTTTWLYIETTAFNGFSISNANYATCITKNTF
jgi:hypothetical protein